MNNYFKETKKHLTYISRQEFEYDINISLKHKYIYVETPKVGCSTIKDTLQRMELEYPDLVRDDFEDIHERGCSPLLKPSQTCGLDRLLNDSNYFVFCFVRDPYSRLLSSYLDKIVKGFPQKRFILQALGDDPSDLSKEISFSQFANVVCSQSISEMNPHWRIQYYQTFQDTIEYDYIGRMETFFDDCVYVFSKIKDNYREYFRSEKRHATNSDRLLKEYYTDSIKEMVFNKYRKDFEYFGFKKI
jgi:hypothetical protein